MDASESEIAAAVAVLRGGGLVGFPTETVYGLGADASNPVAVGRIFAVKGRPTSHPVIVHLASAGMVGRWARRVPREANLLSRAFWPGPLTLVLPRDPRVPDAVTGGRDSVGLRVPSHPVALALLKAFDGGIAAPSANRFGHVSPTTAAHVRADLGDDVDLVLDGGPSQVGVESTIVDCSGDEPEVLRLGGVGIEALAQVLGGRLRLAPGLDLDVEGDARPDGGAAPEPSPSRREPDDQGEAAVRAPGMQASHYAPRARVEVVADLGVAPRAAVLLAEGRRVALLAPEALDVGRLDVIELEPAGPAEDFARVLYDRFRQADRLHVDVLLVVPPQGGGLGPAVRDRLRRAATPPS